MRRKARRSVEQAQEARGQEGAQAGAEQSREPVVTAEELRIAQKMGRRPDRGGPSGLSAAMGLSGG